MAAAGAALRLRLLYQMLRAGEVLALVAFVSWTSTYVPSAVAAALRLAGSLLLNARFVFLLGNAIVLLLFALSRHDLSSSSSSSAADEHQPAPAGAATATAASPQQQAAVPVAAGAGFASFTTTPTTTLPSDTMLGAAAFTTTPPAAPSPTAMEEAPRRRDQALPLAAFEDKLAQPAVTTTTATARVSKARAPRRLRSEKMTSARRAASPELRRCESENGRRRRSSVTARDAEACWGREDADEFRRTVEAFIARQTRFHREESIKSGTMAAGHCEAAPAITGALAVVE